MFINCLFKGNVHCSPKCSGNPRSYNGKPCASTTHYADGHKGACGCGWSGGDTPFPWMISGFTTAPNSYFFDNHLKGWCGGNCGRCVKLTTTGNVTSCHQLCLLCRFSE